MLFSNIYLTNRIKPDDVLERDLVKVFHQVQRLWDNAQDNGVLWSESETEKYFVQPVLEILAWSFAIQVKVREIGDITCPDYTLFRDALSRALGTSHGERSPDFYNRSLAVAEAKHWGRSLDARGETQRDTWKAHANPGHQMVGYLKASGVSWGVLTNGPVWRLYHQLMTGTPTEFYEINLASIFEDVHPEDTPDGDQLALFIRWWRIFHRNAFIPDGTGLSYIERLYEDYIQYGNDVKVRLTNRLIEEAIPSIAEGILLHRYRQFGSGQNAKIDIDDLTSATVNLIYRMLFLFVAEHKGMLPGKESGRQAKGLCAIAKSALDTKKGLHNIYHALINFFRSLYYGDPENNLPPYRGELFDPSRSDFAFLAAHSIPDANMRALFASLTIDGESTVDYECIDGYQLADIGEALLDARITFIELPYGRRELKAKVERQMDMDGQKNSVTRLGNPTIDYLINHTLRNLMDENDHKFTSAMETIVSIRKEHEKNGESQQPDPAYQSLSEVNNGAVEAMLGLRVLDPSMGTGRCLIGVIQYLTDEIICRMQVYHDLHPDIPWDWNPIYVLLDQERKRSQARISRHGFEVKPEEFGDTLLLKRVITLKCVYGVDANPMAVAIAKHNIWLTNFSVGAPFSFLDHHLRHGHAMIGTLVRDVGGSHAQQIREYLAKGVTKALNRIPGSQSELITGRWNSNSYDSFQSAINAYKSLLDLFVLGSLGQPAATDLMDRFGSDMDALYHDSTRHSLTNESHFYHWDIEFPDIFLDLTTYSGQNEPGFHAVISVPRKSFIPGNNPMLQVYLKKHFPMVETLKNSNWYYFAQGLRLLISSGYIAMIMDKKAFVTRAGPLDQVLLRFTDS